MPEVQQFIHHNADHPYEHQVVLMVDRYLKSKSFPAKRIQVTVTFSPTVSSFSKHKLDVKLLGNKPSGTVEIIYNSLYLAQDPVSFLDSVVPHEVAHVLNEVSAFKSGIEVQEHGIEWAEWLESLSDRAEPAASLSDAEFDDRGIVLNNGGVLAVCECEDDHRFHAYRNSGSKVASLRRGDVECKVCGSTLTLADFSDLPSAIRADIEFIKQDLRERNT